MCPQAEHTCAGPRQGQARPEATCGHTVDKAGGSAREPLPSMGAGWGGPAGGGRAAPPGFPFLPTTFLWPCPRPSSPGGLGHPSPAAWSREAGTKGRAPGQGTVSPVLCGCRQALPQPWGGVSRRHPIPVLLRRQGEEVHCGPSLCLFPFLQKADGEPHTCKTGGGGNEGSGTQGAVCRQMDWSPLLQCPCSHV